MHSALMKSSRILRHARHWGRTLALAAGLLCAIASTSAMAQQPATGAEAAQAAYHALAAQNYAAAIESFQKALATDPSNTPWHKDLGYAYLSAGQREEAAREFAVVFRDHPDDLAMALQLGYLSQQLGRDEAAVQYFQAALKSADSRIAVDAQKALDALAASQLTASKQKAYDLLAQGHTQEALALFEAVHEKDPQDSAVTMQLGYLSQQLGRDEEAVQYFQTALKSADSRIAGDAQKALDAIAASQLTASKQKAYDLLAQGHTQEALALFEAVHDKDPQDSAVTMQLGYIYKAAKNTAKAREMFAAARGSADPKVAAQAAAALDQLRRDSQRWFSSVYLAPFYQSRFENEINPASAKIGLKLDAFFQPYIGLRFSRDVRSKSGTLPVIYSDNTAVLSVGVQTPLPKLGLTFYAEAGNAVSLLSHPLDGRAIPDYRAGMFFFRGWGTSLAASARGDRTGLSHTGSAYAEAGFYSRYNNNGIASVQIHEGWNLPTQRVIPMQALGTAILVKDSNGYFYNNSMEVGPHLRLAPARHYPDLFVDVEYLRGFYIEHDSANPYRPRYGDVRVFLVWSKSF